MAPTPKAVTATEAKSVCTVWLAKNGRQVTVACPRPPWYLPEDVLGVSMYRWIYLAGILNADRDAAVSRYIRRRGDAIDGADVAAHPPRAVLRASRNEPDSGNRFGPVRVSLPSRQGRRCRRDEDT